MPFRTLLRTSPAVWLMPFVSAAAIAFSALYASDFRDPYPLGLTADGAIALGFIAPIAAAAGAWEAGRLRRAGWVHAPHVRRPITIAAWALLPVVIAGCIELGAAVFYSVWSMGVPIPDLRVVGASFAIIAVHALVGFGVGRHVEVVIAAPAVLIIDWFWMAVPRALEPFWIRHLNGDLSACCQTDAELAPEVLGAGLIVGAGLFTLGIIAVHARRLLALVVGVIPVTISLAIGMRLVYNFGPTAEVPRSPTDLICTDQSTVVCVWPEHRPQLDSVAKIADRAASAWSATGLRLPREFTEARPEVAGAEAASFGIGRGADDWVILNSLAYSLMPVFPECAYYRAYPSHAADYVLAYLTLSAGMPRSEVAERYDAPSVPGEPPLMATVDQVLASAITDQRRWVERNLAALTQCGVEPELSVP